MKILLALLCIALAWSSYANPVVAQQSSNAADNHALNSADELLIDAIRNNRTESFFAAMDPELLKFLDRGEIERRLNMLSKKASSFDLSAPASVSPHPQLGSAQTEIVFLGKPDVDSKRVAFTIGRDKNDRLIGIEVVSNDWSFSTMDAVADSGRLH